MYTKSLERKFRHSKIEDLPLTSCICSFLPTVLVLLNGVNFVLLSVRGTDILHAERDGVDSGCALMALDGATFDVVDGGIFVTVDGVGCGRGCGNSSSLHGVDVLGSHDVRTSSGGRSGRGLRQDTGRNMAGGGWAGSGGG